ncbi:MAG: hypothetical protein IJV06_10370 [Bacteroidaceae bacterium]|nr:hypothetical protein [Bacteroidaceae bacterium]
MAAMQWQQDGSTVPQGWHRSAVPAGERSASGSTSVATIRENVLPAVSAHHNCIDAQKVLDNILNCHLNALHNM